jgi:hypothetical protein
MKARIAKVFDVLQGPRLFGFYGISSSVSAD